MTSPALDILLEQYQIAVQLYQHEDELNWAKLNHLFYINSGLWAIVGFILQADIAQHAPLDPNFVVTFVSAVGLVVSVAFEIALWYGTLYMYSRKNAVIHIEKALIEQGGAHLVSVPTEAPSYLHRSPTMWMLRAVPALFTLAWLAMLGIQCVRPLL